MFNKNSITFKYLKTSIFIVIIPIFAANIFLNKLYLDTLLGSYSYRVLQNIEQVSLEISNEIKSDTSQALTIANDSEIIDLVNNWSKADNNYKIPISKQVEDKLSYLTDLDTVVFFFKSKGIYYCKGKPALSEEELRRNIIISGSGKDSEIRVIEALTDVSDTSENRHIRSIIVNKPVTGSNNIEAVYFAFNARIFNDMSNFKVFGNSGQIFITDSKGNVLVSQSKYNSGKALEDVNALSKKLFGSKNTSMSTIDGKKMLVTSFAMPENGLQIFGLVDYKDLTRDTGTIKNFSLLFTCFIIILFLVFSVLFFRDILIPINNLNKKMQIVEKGYLDTAIEIRGNDEINNLGKSFNKMVSEIRKLINERDTKEKEKEKAEIEALQSQINPHFISNTLNSIRLMAMIARIDSIKNMTDAFIKLLTSTFNRRGVFNTVETETDILKSYVYIMKVRFGDKFEVRFEVDDNIRQYYILKLLLQPILENAILHGISGMEDKGLICVKGYRLNDDLLFEIRDNGKGMTREELNELMSEGYRNTKGFNGMGLLNVDKRIKLNHGDEYGLKIESVFGEFTNVKILLPTILFEQGGTFNV